MVELLVFAPGEAIDDKEFAEVMLRLPARHIGGYSHAAAVVLDQFGEARGQVRFAMRRRPGLNPRDAATVNPLAVACPQCHAKAWDPCVLPGPTTIRIVSEITHAPRHAAAKGSP